MSDLVQFPELTSHALYVVNEDIPVGQPAILTSLLGRERELGQLAALLDAPHVRILTLTGPGGVGKTRLALELMTTQGDRFPDGVRYVSLADVHGSQSWPAAVRRALQQCGAKPGVSVAKPLHEQAMLLVLDGIERLLGGSMAWLVDLLVASPHVKLIVTSRIALGLPGEQLFPVKPLPLPQTGSIGGANTSAAVTLFLQRARSLRPDFVPTHEELTAIAEICRRLDGLPLAIELAASRMNILTPISILVRMTDRFSLLSGSSGSGQGCLRSMRETLAWSVDLLSPAARILFRRLSVFTGGFTLDAAMVVAHGDGSRDDRESLMNELASLADQSLLQQVSVPSGRARFTMLETIRELAALQLEASGEGPAIRSAHAAWCLDLIAELRSMWMTVSPKDAGDRLALELDNLRAAMSWLDRNHNQRALVQLASALFMFWFVRDYFPAGGRWPHNPTSVIVSESEDEVARKLAGATALSSALNDSPLMEILRVHGEGLPPIAGPLPTAIVAPTGGESGQPAESRDALPPVHMNRARRLAERSLSVQAPKEILWGVIESLNLQAEMAEEEGDLAVAANLFRESLRLPHDTNDPWQVTFPLQRLAIQAMGAGHGTVSLVSPDGIAISPREMDVLRLLHAKLTDQQIADTLFISRRTVNTHVSHLLGKLDVGSRQAAVQRATTLGLLTATPDSGQYT